MKAICSLSGDISGEICFSQESPLHLIKITGFILNLPRGLHGIHVHEFGDTSNGCTSAGEHFNPTGQTHGAPNATVRHVGDLGNVESFGINSLTEINIVDNVMSLFGPHSILGRSLVVHTDRDDLGLTDHPLSRITGNSGGRLGCGIIGVTNSYKEASVK
ncbi:sod [Helicoverpa armigera nucleopolyhedrovirus]|uniref:superoxide dismutase n=1 Tax=Helicoverpa armigera nucleopolyhedrovirus TaxID=51313 RepID=Q91BV1_9ABAC|nr:sod [Helicoverpa armigera nucleopolyhedrovirus]AAK96349.1 sod [Helicoverpa armigera nucleopolyhedrovirus]UCC42574.1 sod [Helicoverpa armigera nucleopolyhedrovirus]